MSTPQVSKWSEEFGAEYTIRNYLTLEEFEKKYVLTYGTSRTMMFEEFIGDQKKDIKILEVGCNIGLQLRCLENLGFENLWGVEPQKFALNQAKLQSQSIHYTDGDIFDIPYKNEYFDLILISGVFIHIHPDDLRRAIWEVLRCTKKHILIFEYYSDNIKEILYHGEKNLLWKTDYANLFKTYCPNLMIEKRKKYKYLNNDNVDEMALLKKVVEL